MRKVLAPFLILMFIGVSALAVSAQRGQWRELGSREVDYNVDHDTIMADDFF